MFTSLDSVTKTQSVLSLYKQASNINYNLSTKVDAVDLEARNLIEDIENVAKLLNELGTNLLKLYTIEQTIGSWMGIKSDNVDTFM